jgi:hypothetical protein
MAVSNGTSALIYVHPDHPVVMRRVRAFLEASDWAGQVFGPDDLDTIGHVPSGGLAFAVSMRASEELNAFGIPGSSLVAQPCAGKPDRLGCGQHGGLATFEQAPFLLASGAGFAPGAIRQEAARVIDIAPTVLAHLSLADFGMDGQALQKTDAVPAMEEARGQTSR